MKLFTIHQSRWTLSLALLCFVGALNAQISLGIVEYAIDAQTDSRYKVEGQVEFSYAGGDLTLTTQLTNTGINRLSGLYVLKPFDFGATTSITNPEGYDFLGNPDPSSFSVQILTGSEDQWELANTSGDSKHEFWKGFDDLVQLVNDNSITVSTAQTLAKRRTDTRDYYVGVEAEDYHTRFERRLLPHEGIEVTWSFSVGSLANAQNLVSNYTTSEWPLIFARWNELNEHTGNKFNWAKGWTDVPIMIVPEPSIVGLLGFALPLGLIVVRRRRRNRR